ncbi:MAG: threonine--tRNA ligase [Candidatus Azotimanducaceae bacterium]
MISVTLPDGSIKELDSGSNGFDLAESIGPGLAKSAIAMTVDQEQRDLCDPLADGDLVSIITVDSEDGLEIMRHTLAAQVLASAVKNLYPSSKLAIGPTIENGFYYDVLFEEPISSDDLASIEDEMRRIIKTQSKIEKSYNGKQEVVSKFLGLSEFYKAEIVQDSDQQDNFQIYEQMDSGFIDLCRGPHLPSLSHVGEFKLTNISGAYWKGDSQNQMLTRIYGTAWKNKKDLKAYLTRLEEAEKRDHRRLGREMDLFHLQEEGPGAVFWHPKGWTMFQQLIDYMRLKQNAAGYQEVNTPEILDRTLWDKSGHLEKFGENMYLTQTPDDRIFAIKPMNCPGHVQIFKQGIKSYRDLPLYLAEFGKVHRYEPSGSLHGLMRVRAFTQDDAHIFCTEEQITEECVKVTRLVLDIYKDFGFEDVIVKFSDRPEKRVGSDEIWDRSEAALKIAVEAAGLDYKLNPGEGAFYGPKLEFVLRDAIGRDWQCGTIQVDLNLPERLGATFVDSDGERREPVMIHRALFGSVERFCGILIEHFAGRLPFWLSPTQIMIASITDEANDYARVVKDRLRALGLRVELDLRNEKISYKVREHSVTKIPAILVVGKREAEESTVAVRRLGGKEQDMMSLDEAALRFKEEGRSPLEIAG